MKQKILDALNKAEDWIAGRLPESTPEHIEGGKFGLAIGVVTGGLIVILGNEVLWGLACVAVGLFIIFTGKVNT